MDLRLYLSVLWRFRVVVALGVVVAVLLTVLSIARINFSGGSPKLSYRQQEGWTSTATVWVTQAGFPLGRSVYNKFLKGQSSSSTGPLPVYSDPSRFSDYATIYANLITSDPVTSRIEKQGGLDGTISATQQTIPGNSSLTLPFVSVAGTAPTQAAAESLTNRAVRALSAYVQEQQARNHISGDQRVVLQVVQRAQSAILTKPRKLTQPIVVFLATLMVAIGLAFLLENLRPRVRALPEEVPEAASTAPAAAAARRTA
jgi:capsular polysaccharide biosynthesis protein